MEFTVENCNPDSLFPIQINFSSTRPFCEIAIEEVRSHRIVSCSHCREEIFGEGSIAVSRACRACLPRRASCLWSLILQG